MSEDKLKNILKEFGYNLSFSYDDLKCRDELIRHLGKSEFKKFWRSVDEQMVNSDMDIEEFIMRKLMSDIPALKILFSGQIAISYEILKVIYEQICLFIKGIKTINILELGGLDGWASCFIKRSMPIDSTITMIDLNAIKIDKANDIFIIKSAYNDYHSSNKYDIVFSILGAPISNIDELIECCQRNIKINGYVYLGIRVQPSEDKIIFEKFKKLGFISRDLKPLRVKVDLDTGTQYIPIFSFMRKD